MAWTALPSYALTMDCELSLHELTRLEAERKLRSLPEAALETGWVREAQVEAVIDAVLAVALGGDAQALAGARHAGEWSARIATALPGGPDPSLARRVGVLSQIDAAVLERIAELRHIASVSSQLRLIASVAGEFDKRISPDEHNRCASPNIVLRAMLANADDAARPIVKALETALQPARHARVA
jgi:hypothetical protein